MLDSHSSSSAKVKKILRIEKDLSLVLGDRLRNVLMIENSLECTKQQENVLRVSNWDGVNKNDFELRKLTEFILKNDADCEYATDLVTLWNTHRSQEQKLNSYDCASFDFEQEGKNL